MEATIRRPRTELIAYARMRDDGAVIYTEEGTPIQGEIFPLWQIATQLVCNGALPENADKFVRDLQLHGSAELRQHVMISSILVC